MTPMQTFKSIYKSTLFVAFLLAGFLLWVSGLPFVTWSAHWRWRWRCWAFRGWARANAALLGMNLLASGNAPRQPSLLVANHLSYLDVIVLAASCDAVFVAKSEIAHWPLIGFLSRCMGTIFIERQRKRDILRVNTLIESALRDGKTIIVFPEGTTSSGVNVLPFKSPLLAPAVKLGVPVHYASLHYATVAPAPPASTALCWWGEADFVPHLWRVFQLDAFNASLHFGAHAFSAENRKTLARALHIRVATNFERLQIISEITELGATLAGRATFFEEALWLKQ